MMSVPIRSHASSSSQTPGHSHSVDSSPARSSAPSPAPSKARRDLVERLWRAVQEPQQELLQELRERLELQQLRSAPPSSENALQRAQPLDRAWLDQLAEQSPWDDQLAPVDQLAHLLRISCRWRAAECAAAVLHAEPAADPTEGPSVPSAHAGGQPSIELSSVQTSLTRAAAQGLRVEVASPHPNSPHSSSPHSSSPHSSSPVHGSTSSAPSSLITPSRVAPPYPSSSSPGVDSPGMDSPGMDSPGLDSPGMSSPSVSSSGSHLAGSDAQSANRPVANRPVANRPVANRPVANRPVPNRPSGARSNTLRLSSPGVVARASPSAASPSTAFPSGASSSGASSSGASLVPPGVDTLDARRRETRVRGGSALASARSSPVQQAQSRSSPVQQAQSRSSPVAQAAARSSPVAQAAARSTPQRELQPLFDEMIECAEGRGESLRASLKELGQLLHGRRCSLEEVIGALRCFRAHPDLLHSVLKLMMTVLPSDSPDVWTELWNTACERLSHAEQRSLLRPLAERLLHCKIQDTLLQRLVDWVQGGDQEGALVELLLQRGFFRSDWIELAARQIRLEGHLPLLQNWLTSSRMSQMERLELFALILTGICNQPHPDHRLICGLAQQTMALDSSPEQHNLLICLTEWLLEDEQTAINWVNSWPRIGSTPERWQRGMQAMLSADVEEDQLVQVLGSCNQPLSLDVWRAALQAEAGSPVRERALRLLAGVLEKTWSWTGRVKAELVRLIGSQKGAAMSAESSAAACAPERASPVEGTATALLSREEWVQILMRVRPECGAELLSLIEALNLGDWTHEQRRRLSPLLIAYAPLDQLERILASHAEWRSWIALESSVQSIGTLQMRWEYAHLSRESSRLSAVLTTLMDRWAQTLPIDPESSLAPSYWVRTLLPSVSEESRLSERHARHLILVFSVLSEVQEQPPLECFHPVAQAWISEIRSKLIPVSVMNVLEESLHMIQLEPVSLLMHELLEARMADQMERIAEGMVAEAKALELRSQGDRIVEMMRDMGWLPLWRLIAGGGQFAVSGMGRALVKAATLEGAIGHAVQSMIVGGISEQPFWLAPASAQSLHQGLSVLSTLTQHTQQGCVLSPAIMEVCQRAIGWVSRFEGRDLARALSRFMDWIERSTFSAHPADRADLSLILAMRMVVTGIGQADPQAHPTFLGQAFHRKVCSVILAAGMSLYTKPLTRGERESVIDLLESLSNGEYGPLLAEAIEFRLLKSRLEFTESSTPDDGVLQGFLPSPAAPSSSRSPPLVFPRVRAELLRSFAELDRAQSTEETRVAAAAMLTHAVLAEARFGTSPDLVWKAIGGSFAYRLSLIGMAIGGIMKELNPAERGMRLIEIVGKPALSHMPTDEEQLKQIAAFCALTMKKNLLMLSSHLLFWRASFNQIEEGSGALEEKRAALVLAVHLLREGGYPSLAGRVQTLLARPESLNLAMLRQEGFMQITQVLRDEERSPSSGAGRSSD